jgi:hypothetical protein
MINLWTTAASRREPAILKATKAKARSLPAHIIQKMEKRRTQLTHAVIRGRCLYTISSIFMISFDYF